MMATVLMNRAGDIARALRGWADTIEAMPPDTQIELTMDHGYREKPHLTEDFVSAREYEPTGERSVTVRVWGARQGGNDAGT
jgi:hypothetical protein